MASHQLLLILFFFQCLFSTTKAQSQVSNISLGSTLYTNSTPKYWPSPSGHFAFGFYPSGNGFKVGIWLVGSPNKTIVWTANRNDPPLTLGATLVFSADGKLVIRSSFGQFDSIPKTYLQASVASMHDSGNFVLYNSSLDIVWASFDYPTDTLLVGQALVQGNSLFSSVSDTNRSVGNYKLRLQGNNGNLNAFPVNSLWEGRYIYWSSNSLSSGKNVSLNLAPDSRLYISVSSGFILKNLTQGEHPVSDSFLYRATFDGDGILRVYQHHFGINGSVNVMWKAISDEDRCMVKGICGLNSYCTYTGIEIACLCPPGFIFIDPKQASKGCELNFTEEKACLQPKEKYTIFPLPNTAWERDEYDVLSPVGEEACSKACLEDCNCVVATFRDEACFKHKLPLRYGKKNSSFTIKTMFKIRNGSLADDPTVHKKVGKEILIVGVVLIGLALFLFVSSGYLLLYKRHIWSNKIITKHHDVIEEINLRLFTYNEIVEATDNFVQEVGKGGSGRVYKGSLPGGNEIAVKRLEKIVEEGEYQFRNEMKIIGRTHHKNLVHLIGFCSEGSNRLLVYEFMKNGSLGDLLFKTRKRPSWKERIRISQEIASGIQYLHEECETRIIHCDIKPHNILMDESWCAKISDFGLSKLLKPDQSRTYTIPRGTRGYEAPEWHKNNAPITVKADVYSFGILLFEIVCCRKNMEVNAPDEEIILTNWVHESYRAGQLEKLVGGEEVDMDELENAVKVGLWCLQTELDLRPSMKLVGLMLEGTVVIPPPPPLYSSANG